MKVTLSPELKEYLHKKHREVIEVYVTKIYFERQLEPYLHVEIDFKAPENVVASQFELYDVEGFKVYIEKDIINENQDILFHLGKVFLMKHVEVEGLEVY